MSKILLLLAAFAFANTGFSLAALTLPETETLPNGLRVVWFLSDSLPVVDIDFLVRSGFRDDPAGKSGTAELTAASIDRGAGGLSAQALARSIEMLGATRQVSSEDDHFLIGIHGLAPDAPQLLELLKKMALEPDFPQAEVMKEHARIIDRWRHIADYGEALAGLAYGRILASGTSYSRDGLHSVAEFRKVGRDDVAAFHKRHFTPKNSVLMVVGRVEKSSFREKLISAFGSWSGDAPKRSFVTVSHDRLKLAKREILLVDRPDLSQAQVKIGLRSPLVTSPDHYPLAVADALLGGYFNSRLNAIVRDKLGLTYAIGSSFSYAREFASFTISSATRNEMAGKLISETFKAFKDLKTNAVPKDEVDVAKDYLRGGFVVHLSTLAAVASRWVWGYLLDLGPDYLNEYMPKVGAVSAEQVSSAVVRNFDLDNMVVVIAGNAKAIEKSLRENGFRKIKRVSASDLL